MIFLDLTVSFNQGFTIITIVHDRISLFIDPISFDRNKPGIQTLTLKHTIRNKLTNRDMVVYFLFFSIAIIMYIE